MPSRIPAHRERALDKSTMLHRGLRSPQRGTARSTSLYLKHCATFRSKRAKQAHSVLSIVRIKLRIKAEPGATAPDSRKEVRFPEHSAPDYKRSLHRWNRRNNC